MDKIQSQKLDLYREKSKESLYYFSKRILGFDKLTQNLHRDFCNFIQDFSIPRKIILLPRGHLKTTCSSISFIPWLLIQDMVPLANKPGRELRILIAKESATLAESDLDAIENIFDRNEWIKSLFPYITPPANERKRWNRQEMLVNRSSYWPEATVSTIGVGGAAQGKHFDIIIFDDIFGQNAMESDTVMNATIQWWQYAESLFVSPNKGIALFIGTRWSKRDVAQYILDNDKRYVPYIRQAIENGKPIFPEEFSLEQFDEMRIRNFAHFSSQYLNNPSDPSMCDFKGEWLKYFEIDGDDIKIAEEAA